MNLIKRNQESIIRNKKLIIKNVLLKIFIKKWGKKLKIMINPLWTVIIKCLNEKQ